ncbi:MAG TPA: NAD(P)/FAD-dependent oxidoreductase [Vicinamibacteria bacterium]|nr:NAD(P)/FAD-dependent oxidoreductase [Vicinamibacteria bacterium]
MVEARARGSTPRVVILGGGFAGLYAARVLDDAAVAVTLVDRKNHHLFQPMLYQVATAALNPADIAAPIRSILSGQRNCRVLLAEAKRVDLEASAVITDAQPIPFDYLIVATGASHSYFGHDDWAEKAPGLKTIEDALDIRRRVFLAYESAEREIDPEKRRAFMTFVVIGAGPTGVEMAGALAEISRRTLARDFRTIDPRSARIILVEGVDRVLPPFPEDLSSAARAQLERLGVEVWTGTRVTGIDEAGVTLGADRIGARTVIWAAGVQGSEVAGSLGVELDRAGRVPVNPDLSVPGAPHVFVAGDLASIRQDGSPVPGVCPAAMQAGRHAARNVAALSRGGSTTPFRYVDKGSFAVIGRGAAVGDLFGWKMSGRLAWFAWLGIHITFLIGFRNRIIVLLGWAYSYLTHRRGARLITGN